MWFLYEYILNWWTRKKNKIFGIKRISTPPNTVYVSCLTSSRDMLDVDALWNVMWEMKCFQYKAWRRARFYKSDRISKSATSKASLLNEADVYRDLAINFNSLRKQRIVWVELEKVFRCFGLPADIMGIIWHHLGHKKHKFKSWCHLMVQSHELQQATQQPWNYRSNKKRWEARCRWLECSGYILTLASLK